MSGLLFVTAQKADHKKLNYMLLHLRDWEYGGGDMFMIVTTKNGLNLETAPGEQDVIEATKLPVDTNLDNPWVGAPLEDVEGFVLDLGRADSEKGDASQGLYILVDDDGLENETCIVAQRNVDWESEPMRSLDSFKKMRVPWDEANSMFANLFIANMDFEDWADDSEDDGSSTREWYTYTGLGDEPILLPESVRKRDAEIEKFRAEGKI